MVPVHDMSTCSPNAYVNSRDSLNQLLVKHTGQPIERIKNDTERDYFMSAPEAKDYGIVDDVFVGKAHGKEKDKEKDK